VKFLISVVVLFVVSMAIGFVVHGFFLESEYAKLPNLFRPQDDAQHYFGHMLLAHIVMSVGITWIYRQGREAKPFFMQGVRFGAALAMVVTIPLYLIYYAVQPMPESLVAKQLAFDTVGMLILGVVAAAVNRT
jgi:hypothetical protein